MSKSLEIKTFNIAVNFCSQLIHQPNHPQVAIISGFAGLSNAVKGSQLRIFNPNDKISFNGYDLNLFARFEALKASFTDSFSVPTSENLESKYKPK